MGYKKMNISELIDPEMRCSDELIVNVDKKKSLIAGVIVIGMLIFMLIISYGAAGWFSWGVVIIGLIALLYIIQNLINHNPVLKIDRTGVTFNNREFYSWDSVEKVVYEMDKSNEGSSYLKFYLKNKKVKEVKNDGFWDQPIEIIATYIHKYFLCAH